MPSQPSASNTQQPLLEGTRVDWAMTPLMEVVQRTNGIEQEPDMQHPAEALSQQMVLDFDAGFEMAKKRLETLWHEVCLPENMREDLGAVLHSGFCIKLHTLSR